MNRLSNNGPRTDPCETPDLIPGHELNEVPIFTLPSTKGRAYSDR